MPRVLGIDPGSRLMGYGIIDYLNTQELYITSGCIRLDTKMKFIDRLGQIQPAIKELIASYKPDFVAIEDVFFSKNASSALKLGQARGVALAAAYDKNLTIYEYSTREVKLALVGKGGASKNQVSFMVQHRLNLASAPQVDAGDALAVALCHAQNSNLIMENK